MNMEHDVELSNGRVQSNKQPNIEENFGSWVYNAEYYPDQILPSNIMSPAMNHPQSNVDRLILSIYFMEYINLCLY